MHNQYKNNDTRSLIQDGWSACTGVQFAQLLLHVPDGEGNLGATGGKHSFQKTDFGYATEDESSVAIDYVLMTEFVSLWSFGFVLNHNKPINNHNDYTYTSLI